MEPDGDSLRLLMQSMQGERGQFSRSHVYCEPAKAQLHPLGMTETNERKNECVGNSEWNAIESQESGGEAFVTGGTKARLGWHFLLIRLTENKNDATYNSL